MNRQQRVLPILLLFILLLVIGFVFFKQLDDLRSKFTAGAPPDLLASVTKTVKPIQPPSRSTDPTRGSKDANAIVLTVFGNYGSPESRAFEGELKKIFDLGLENIKVVWRDAPMLGDPPEILLATASSYCAEEQGKFWEMHDQLMLLPKINFTSIKRAANLAGIRETNFENCLNSGKYIMKISNEMQIAKLNYIVKTPTIFIGRSVLTGFVNANTVLTAIRSSKL